MTTTITTAPPAGLTLYHVCNDYSLERDDSIAIPANYTRKHCRGGYGYYNEHDELVYFAGPAGRDGEFI